MLNNTARSTRAIALATLLIASAIVSVAPTASAQSGNDTLIIAMQKDIGNYNFFDIGSNTIWKSYVAENSFDAIAGMDTTGDVYPLLAESWTTISDDPASPDYLKVTATLRPDLRFSDGKPLTADDVVFSYVALRHPGTTYSSFIVSAFDADDDGTASRSEVEAAVVKVDARTVKFTLTKKYGQFYKTTLGIPILPKHIWTDHLKSAEECDLCLDTQWSDPAALIGSGPWKFKDGVKDSRYVIERNDLFWGKTFKTPYGKHPLWSQSVKTVQFDIYASLESAILALRSGKVDHIPWSITPGHIPSLAADPATKLSFISENGYFYLAFNMKQEPMNNIAFRQAVSHLIDKKTVVDVYMGGFGQAGDSHLPPFWAEWYNASAKHYDFDKQKAKDILKAAGFKGASLGNGATANLLMPDGRSVPPIVLLTPPADYDPIRIKTGETVAKNMRELGIDVVAKAIDFNTLVGRMNGFDYQMLIIGWSLSSEAVSNVCDIMGARAPQNYFGFWDPTVANLENPTYKKLGGVSTLADAPTRALVAEVEGHCKVARESFDPATQVKAMKAAQGALSEAVPANVLYYRTNAYATSSEWTGWVTHFGKLQNGYSLASVHLGKDSAPLAKAEDILISLDAPSQVPVGSDREVRVVALKANGLPASGAALTIKVAGMTVQPSASVGTANADGLYSFTLRGKEEGFSTLFVNGTLGGRAASATAPVAGSAGAPPFLFVEGTPSKTFLAPGETSTITWKVRDQNGNPVTGALVKIDEGLLAYGAITGSPITNGDGIATLTYTAPAASAMPPNRHLEVSVVATGTKVGYNPTKGNTFGLPLLVKGAEGHLWNVVSVTGSTRWAADAANLGTTLSVMYQDASGSPIANKKLVVDIPQAAEFTTPPTEVTTGADGVGTITLTWATGTATRAASVRVYDPTSISSIGGHATMLFKGTDGKAGVYGGYVGIDRTGADPDASTPITATVKLFGLDGAAPTADVPLAVVVGSTPFGQVAKLESGTSYVHSSVDDAASVQTTTTIDKLSFATGGSMAGALAAAPVGPYATWADLGDGGYTGVDATTMKALVAKGGTLAFKIQPDALPLADLRAMITVVPNGVLGFTVTDDERNFYWTLAGDTAIGGEYAVWRTAKILGVQWKSDATSLRTLGDGMKRNVSLTVVDQDNVATTDATAKLYHNGLLPASRWPWAVSGAGATSELGTASLTLDGTPGAGYATRSGPHNGFGRHDLFATGKKPGYASLVGSSHVLIAPIATDLRITTDKVRWPDPTSQIDVKITGTDENGKPLAGWIAHVTASKGTFTNLVNGTITLDEDGTATVQYVPPTPSVVPYALDQIKASTAKDTYLGSSASTHIVVVNAIPKITITAPTPDLVTKITTLNVTGQVSDADTIRNVAAKLDQGSFVDLPVGTGLQSAGFVYSLKNLAVGPHTLTIRATDQRGFVYEETVAFTVQLADVAKDDGGALDKLTPAPGLLAALAGLGAAVVLLRRRG